MADISQPVLISDVLEKLNRGNAVRIVGLGDSLTYGWEAAFSYFDLFISRLRTDFCGVTVSGHNAGLCGDTASGGESRVTRLLEDKTDLLIVQFGINDLYSGISLEKYSESLGVIARKAIRASALPLFITSGPLLYPEQQRDIASFYSALHTVAASYDCPVADIAAYWHTHFNDFTPFYYNDGVHPNDAGYRAMADALYQLCIHPPTLSQQCLPESEQTNN